MITLYILLSIIILWFYLQDNPRKYKVITFLNPTYLNRKYGTMVGVTGML